MKESEQLFQLEDKFIQTKFLNGSHKRQVSLPVGKTARIAVTVGTFCIALAVVVYSLINSDISHQSVEENNDSLFEKSHYDKSDSLNNIASKTAGMALIRFDHSRKIEFIRDSLGVQIIDSWGTHPADGSTATENYSIVIKNSQQKTVYSKNDIESTTLIFEKKGGGRVKKEKSANIAIIDKTDKPEQTFIYSEMPVSTIQLPKVNIKKTENDFSNSLMSDSTP